MSLLKSKGFKYFKNLVIGLGASIVLLGALFKIMSWPFADEMLIAGMLTEAILFAFLGIIGPDKDYYWEKLYPGLDDYHGSVAPMAAASGGSVVAASPLNGDVVEKQLGGMLVELQGMSKSLSSLKALQEVDFSATGDQMKSMNNFYVKLNEAMADLADTAEDTKRYKQNIASLNGNLSTLNNVYGNMISAISSGVRQ